MFSKNIYRRTQFEHGKEDCFLEDFHVCVLRKTIKSLKKSSLPKLKPVSLVSYKCHINKTCKCKMKIVVVVDHRAFEFSRREGQIFMIKSMNTRAINRMVHYGNDIGNTQGLIDLNDDAIKERFTWKAVVQDGCYGIFRPTTPAPSTTTTTTTTTTVSIGKKVRKY